MSKTNKENTQEEKFEPWYRIVTPIKGLKERRGGDGLIFEGRLQLLYNPILDVNINISSPIFYRGEEIEIERAGYVGGRDSIYYKGSLIDRGLFVDTCIFYLSDEHTMNFFRNFYFGKAKEKLKGPFNKSEAFCRVRYNSDDYCDSYFSVFKGLPEDYFLLPTVEEQNWKYPHFITVIDKENIKLLIRKDKKTKSLVDMLKNDDRLITFFEKCNPQLLMEIDKSKDILDALLVK